jgi:hypothetical protein
VLSPMISATTGNDRVIIFNNVPNDNDGWGAQLLILGFYGCFTI